MKLEMLHSKIHRATVIESNIDYCGSITISQKLLDAANMYEHQKVLVVDIDNGNRFETYILSSDEEGVICLNGAAARLVHVGDKIIIMTFCYIEKHEAENHKPIIIFVDAENMIVEN